MQNSRVQLTKSIEVFSKKIAALGYDKYPKTMEDIPLGIEHPLVRIKPTLPELKLTQMEMEDILKHHESAGRHEIYQSGDLVIQYQHYEFDDTDVAYKVTRYYTDEYNRIYPVQQSTILVSSECINYDYDRTWEDLHGCGEPESEFNFFAQCRG